MENLIVIFLLLFLGVGLARLKVLPANSAQTLNLFVVYVSLPALVLLRVPQLSFSSQVIAPLVLPWIMLCVSALLVLACSRLFHWSREITGALLLMIPLGNTSFFGIPMVAAFFGDSGVPYAVLYDQLGSFPALSTYGAIILATYSGGSKPAPAAIVKKILTFPPFIALIIGLFLMGTTLPLVATNILEMVAASLVPVVMVAIGLQITLKLPPGSWGPFGIGLGLRLVVAPVVALFLCLSLGFSGPAVQVAIFESGMPPMVTAGALAMIAGLAPQLTAALVGLGILASFATLPLLYKLIGMFLG